LTLLRCDAERVNAAPNRPDRSASLDAFSRSVTLDGFAFLHRRPIRRNRADGFLHPCPNSPFGFACVKHLINPHCHTLPELRSLHWRSRCDVRDNSINAAGHGLRRHRVKLDDHFTARTARHRARQFAVDYLFQFRSDPGWRWCCPSVPVSSNNSGRS
jgi:hypothetical protein